MSEKTSMRSFSKKEGKCPKCGFKGAMELVETDNRKYPMWFHIVAIFCTAGLLYLAWRPKKGGVKLSCPSCNHLF